MKKWLNRFIVGVLIVGLQCGAFATSDEPPAPTATMQATSTATVATETSTASPTEVATETPTDTPTETPTQTPTDAPTEIPTEAPTDTPTEVPTEAPSAEPTETPAPSKTAPSTSPGESISPAPSESPSTGPSIDPTVTPTPEPSEKPEYVGPDSPTEDILSVQNWLTQLGYLVEGQNNGIYDETTIQAVTRFQTDINAEGLITLEATGLCDSSTLELLEERASGATPSPSPSKMPGFPGGGGGSWGSGGGSWSGGTGTLDSEQDMNAETGGVTPGEALTSSHSSGTKNTSIYGTVALESDSTAMSTLVLGGETLNIALDGGTFTAAITENHLDLHSDTADGQTWTLDGLALRTLSKSGIETLRLIAGDSAILVPTSGFLSGTTYESLRARGYTDNVLKYTLTYNGSDIEVQVQVGNESYIASTASDSEMQQTGIIVEPAPTTEASE